MANSWKIKSGDVTGNGEDLVGCHIKENAAGTAYVFTDSNPNTVLSTTTGSTLPSPTFSFPTFLFEGYNWDITVTTLTGGASQNKAEGTWSNDASGIKDTEAGDWTAQAGSTVGDDTGEEAAESAASGSK